MDFRQEALELVVNNGYRSLVEVGVWKAELSGMLYGAAHHLILVDPWSVEWNRFSYKGVTYECTMGEPFKSQAELDEMYLDVRGRFPRATVYRMDSVQASAYVSDRSVDFVFIDAVHTYEHCTADIKFWLPKIRSGGMIAGDDFYPPHNAVSRAVEEELSVGGFDRVWYKTV